MILRSIAESDYHFDAAIVKDWTFYQLRMYLCEKKCMNAKVEFATSEEALAYAAASREQKRPKLKTFNFEKV